MNEKELFDIVLKSFINKYHLTIVYPYKNSGYFKLLEGNNIVADMNPDGYNLLSNLNNLTKQLEYLLR